MNLDEILTKKDLLEFEKRVFEHISKFQNPNIPLRVIRSRELIKRTGISSSTLQNLRLNGTLPYTKVGGMIFYNLDDVENLFSNKTDSQNK